MISHEAGDSCRPLRGLYHSYFLRFPGVCTPGYMLTPALRASFTRCGLFIEGVAGLHSGFIHALWAVLSDALRGFIHVAGSIQALGI